MNAYKNLFFIITLLTYVTTSAHESQNTSDKQVNHNIQRAQEDALINFVIKTNPEAIRNGYISAITERYNFLTTMKPHTKNSAHKEVICTANSILLENEQIFRDLYQFVSRPNCNDNDIQEFAPRFVKCSETLKSYEKNQSLIHNLFDTCNEIAENDAPQKNNLGNWVRNTQTAKQQIIESLYLKDNPKEKPTRYRSNIPTKNSPLQNFVKNTQFSFDNPGDKNIKTMHKPNIEKYNRQTTPDEIEKNYQKNLANDQILKTLKTLGKKHIDRAEQGIAYTQEIAYIQEIAHIKECYKILEIPNSTPQSGIDKALYKLIRQWHQDKNLNNPKVAEEIVKKHIDRAEQEIAYINECYKILEIPNSAPQSDIDNKCYKILEIPNSTPQSGINKAFYKLIRQWHPDKHLNNPEVAEENRRKIYVAYQILLNEDSA